LLDPITEAVGTRLCPPWLVQRLQEQEGSVPFRTYMDWVLHDPDHGAYASGRLRIGPKGDFSTAPSLSDDFAALLAPQLASWLAELGDGPLALIETGPGEGTLAADLAARLVQGWPQLAARTELVLVDPSAGLVERQHQRLVDCPLPVRWSSFEQLAAQPLVGVVLAHEVLDALPVERVIWDGAQWRRQRVTLRSLSDPTPEAAGPGAADPAVMPLEGGPEQLALQALELVSGEPLEPGELRQLELLGILDPGPQRSVGFSSELHPGLQPWLEACGVALERGVLLVIDYALEAFRYYAPARSAGTLMAYRAQQACSDPLRDPGHWDLTAHLCLESLQAAAQSGGWRQIGACRQGQALLALGLAQRLHGLQQRPELPLAELLARREALLRLVDPAALGDFRWVAFARGSAAPDQLPLFVQEPTLA
jgi:SAM-dependent MidA family methyltransferase